MTIILLHGDDIISSKKELDSTLKEAKKKGFSIFYISAGKLNLSEQVSARGLFEKESLYVLENANKVPLTDFKWLTAHQKTLAGTLVIYNEGPIGARVKNLLPKNLAEKEFKLPPLIFSFLNSFYPGNSIKTVKLLHVLASTEPMEKVIHFLARHLRDLYWVSRDPSLLPYKEDWRILKALSQAKRFKKGQIEAIIADLAEADVVSKTGDTQVVGLLDQLIASRLE